MDTLTVAMLRALCMILLPTSIIGYNPHVMDWRSPELTPWPRPSYFTNGSTMLLVNASTFDVTTNCSSSLLSRAFGRYTNLVFKNSPPSITAPKASSIKVVQSFNLRVEVIHCSEDLDFGTDEAHSLNVYENGHGDILAVTVFGALRALESFSQLFERLTDRENNNFLLLRGLPWSISDRPRFAHRGVLLDTSRHFLPMQTIQAFVDAMSYSKVSTSYAGHNIYNRLDIESSDTRISCTSAQLQLLAGA